MRSSDNPRIAETKSFLCILNLKLAESVRLDNVITSEILAEIMERLKTMDNIAGGMAQSGYRATAYLKDSKVISEYSEVKLCNS